MTYKTFKPAVLAGLTFCAAVSAAPVFAQDHHDHSQHEHHKHIHNEEIKAPIGVMRDHVHEKGKFMTSYRFGFMAMIENRDGSSSVSDASVLQDFMVAPTDMTMRMHMLSLMYGVSDDVTISAMGGFVETDMDHQRRNLTTFETEAQDWGDTSINALYQVYNDGQHRVQLNAGVSIPTGSMNRSNPAGTRLPYAMQIGSGTYDFLPGISYSGQSGDGEWGWGGQVNATLRLGDNNYDYALGDRVQATAWGVRKLTKMVGVSARLNYESWGDIDGSDPAFGSAPFMARTMDSNRYGGERLEGLVGTDLALPEWFMGGQRFALEAGMPLYENLDGPRLGEEFRVTFGLQHAF